MLQFFVGRLASIAASVGIAAGSVVGTPTATLSGSATVGIPAGSVVGSPTATTSLSASIGISSGSVLGGPVATLSGTAVVGIPSGSVTGAPVLSSTLPASVGIPAGSIVGSPASNQGLAASAGIPSGSVLGGPTVGYSGTAQLTTGIPSGSIVGTPAASNPAATESLEKMIADVLLASPLLSAFDGRIWTRGAREGTKLPYAVVHDFSRVPEYHSKGRHHEVDDAQVTVYAATAAEANLLAEVCNNLLTFADLKTEGVTNIRLRSRRSMVEKGRDNSGRLVYSEVLSYRGSVERLTPNK